MQNLYDLLGVRPDDDAENLRKAYHKAVKESHPDHHNSDPEAASRFRRITEAYGVLRNAERRAAYDQRLEFERRPLRWKLRRALSDIKRHALYDVLAGAVLAAVLATAYEWHVGGSATFFDEATVIIAPGTGQDFGDPPVAQSDAAGRGRFEQRVAAQQMPIVVPIAPPAENDGGDPEMTPREPAPIPSGEIKLAARDNESDGGVDLVDRHEMPEPDVQSPAPNPSSSSVLVASAERRDAKPPEPSGANAGAMKLPEIKTMTGRPQQTAAKRHVASRLPAPVDQAALENRDSAAPDNAPSLYVFGVGY
jgi:hypothetical protein